MPRTHRDRHPQPQSGGREGQLGVGSAGKGVRETLVPERRNLGFELAEKEVRCGGWGRGHLWTWMKSRCAGHLGMLPRVASLSKGST